MLEVYTQPQEAFMNEKIVECVPNFSEGRRPEVLSAIESAIRSVANVTLLNQHTDADHNRTVFTFAGPPKDVSQAAFNAIKTAAELIDLDQHEGEHPRIGATDVVPFIPISGLSMDDCVKLAKELGKRVGEELQIPVYLYEAAATRPDRKNLEDVRRGQYEELKASIEQDPERAPDFGPKKLGKAGATVIGARAFLIAFNVYLGTEDVSIAKKIAHTIRYSSGGLRFVKALGLLVNGEAQVSMNLTDFTRTPIALVVELIRREAARYGTNVKHSELVGLIPQAALVDAAQWYLQLDELEPDQVLETRLSEARKNDESQETSFLEQLAADTATPGGGSAAAYTAAMAASLVAMVARLTIGKKKYADVENQMTAIIDEADQLQVDLNNAVSQDAEAFQAVMKAYALPKSTEKEQAQRNEAIEKAIHKAAEVPLQVASRATKVLELASQVAQDGNVNAITDAGSAGMLAIAALQAAAMNVRINAQSTSDRPSAEAWLNNLHGLEKAASEFQVKLREIMQKRGGIETKLT
jgi:glutamate formiminotransferase/formiminotetrahydrofolate cyclodeaminase